MISYPFVLRLPSGDDKEQNLEKPALQRIFIYLSNLDSNSTFEINSSRQVVTA